MTGSRLTLGVDVGATKIAAAVVDRESGAIGSRSAIETRAEDGPEAVLAACVTLADRVAGDDRVAGVGVGVCELVDPRGAVTSDQTLDWRGMELASRFAHIAPTRIESDVRAAALAEAAFGAGRGMESFLYVNAGSGISSCLVVDGAPFPGARGNAICIGGGPLDVEEVAGGIGIARNAGMRSAAEVAAAAASGEAVARETIEAGGRALGGAVAFAVNILDPEAVLLGGSVVLGSELFRNALERAVRRHVWSVDTRTVPLVDAQLGPDAGVIGAAMSAPAG